MPVLFAYNHTASSGKNMHTYLKVNNDVQTPSWYNPYKRTSAAQVQYGAYDMAGVQEKTEWFITIDL